MISGKILRDAIISGANNINNQRSRVDELNVFPVPDGDTGTNMGMTVGAAVRELQAMDDSCTVGEAAKMCIRDRHKTASPSSPYAKRRPFYYIIEPPGSTSIILQENHLFDWNFKIPALFCTVLFFNFTLILH